VKRTAGGARAEEETGKHAATPVWVIGTGKTTHPFGCQDRAVVVLALGLSEKQ
jgi:hypothetical protein